MYFLFFSKFPYSSSSILRCWGLHNKWSVLVLSLVSLIHCMTKPGSADNSSQWPQYSNEVQILTESHPRPRIKERELELHQLRIIVNRFNLMSRLSFLDLEIKMIQIIQIEKDNSWNSFVIIRIFTAADTIYSSTSVSQCNVEVPHSWHCDGDGRPMPWLLSFSQYLQGQSSLIIDIYCHDVITLFLTVTSLCTEYAGEMMENLWNQMLIGHQLLASKD